MGSFNVMQKIEFLIEFNCIFSFVFELLISVLYAVRFNINHQSSTSVSVSQTTFIRNRSSWSPHSLEGFTVLFVSIAFNSWTCWFQYDFKSMPFNWTRRERNSNSTIAIQKMEKKWYLVYSTGLSREAIALARNTNISGIQNKQCRNNEPSTLIISLPAN